MSQTEVNFLTGKIASVLYRNKKGTCCRLFFKKKPLKMIPELAQMYELFRIKGETVAPSLVENRDKEIFAVGIWTC